MHPRTIATLNDLRLAAWFCRVGVRDTESAEVLPSWSAAVESCSSVEWENLCLEAVNRYCEKLVERAPDRFRLWNAVVNEVKPAVQELVREKAGPTIERHSLPKVVGDCIEWDVLHVCMEAEYADIYPPGFFASQAYWYVQGHFPCGWRGDFPKGKLVIY